MNSSSSFHLSAKPLAPIRLVGSEKASEPLRWCACGRRHLLGASSAALLPFSPLKHSAESSWASTPTDVIERFHSGRPDWYQELFARVMDEGMRYYEAQISGYKANLFSLPFGDNKNVLELGVGTGPNFKYYARAVGLSIVGVDPNKQMEKYARNAAIAAGIPSTNFSFVRGVVEALPAEDNSMDVVIGTLVLCSVKDVDLSLKEVKRVLKPGGLYLFIEHVADRDDTLLRLAQTVLDPLQQLVADGCHLTRETGKRISAAGFSTVNLNMTFLSNVPLVSPHIYGMACK